MPRTIRIAGLALLFAGLVTGSPVYAESHEAPGMMQEGGDMQATGMEGMMGMMGMMERMSAMMTLCETMMGTTPPAQKTDPT